MQTATLGSVPCLPCDIGTVLSQQPIACQARRVGSRAKIPSRIPRLEDSGAVRGAAIRLAVASIETSVGGFDAAHKADDILPLAKRRRRRQSGIVPALSDRRFNCLPPATGL